MKSIFALGAVFAGWVAAATAEVGGAAVVPLGAMLEEYAYPHEVRFMEVECQQQRLKMAYMDVKAERANGRAVLLLHGKNFSGAYWKETIRALAADGYRVVVPDQVGFGKSSKPTAYQYSLHSFAEQTRRLLGEMGVERVSVVGHSMGGMVAVRFSLMFPEVTERLVMVNPIGLEDWKRVVPYQNVDDVAAAEAGKDAAAVREYMSKAYFAGGWAAAYDPLIEIQAGWQAGPDRMKMARVSAMTREMLMTQPVMYEFPDLRVPTLLIIGTRDRTALGKELVEMEGLGHLPQYEDFRGYFRVLSDFLK